MHTLGVSCVHGAGDALKFKSYTLLNWWLISREQSAGEAYNDTDLMFMVDVPLREATEQFNVIRDLVLDSLLHALTVLTEVRSLSLVCVCVQ